MTKHFEGAKAEGVRVQRLHHATPPPGRRKMIRRSILQTHETPQGKEEGRQPPGEKQESPSTASSPMPLGLGNMKQNW